MYIINDTRKIQDKKQVATSTGLQCAADRLRNIINITNALTGNTRTTDDTASYAAPALGGVGGSMAPSASTFMLQIS
jgi:hypothetical protein